MKLINLKNINGEKKMFDGHNLQLNNALTNTITNKFYSSEMNGVE